MSKTLVTPTDSIPVDITNPGQFFACCGILELADRLWPGAKGWFEGSHFQLSADGSLEAIMKTLADSTVTNTMTSEQRMRREELSAMSKASRDATPGLEEEKKNLESLDRELPVVISGGISLCIDWFCDSLSGGSRFKTWAGQQSVLKIAQAMHSGITGSHPESPEYLWSSVRGVGLPFNFDSDLGAQGAARDIGFSFDPLATNETTRIEITCTPALELLCFIGLQRFRPREVGGENRYLYSAWQSPVPASIAAPLACGSIQRGIYPTYAFPLLYRTKYLKSFLPAQPIFGDRYE